MRKKFLSILFGVYMLQAPFHHFLPEFAVAKYCILKNVQVVFMGGTFIGWLSGIDGCRQLLRLTRKGADPFKFKFVEHHKVWFQLQ
jgi:hypothetical protein